MKTHASKAKAERYFANYFTEGETQPWCVLLANKKNATYKPDRADVPVAVLDLSKAACEERREAVAAASYLATNGPRYPVKWPFCSEAAREYHHEVADAILSALHLLPVQPKDSR